MHHHWQFYNISKTCAIEVVEGLSFLIRAPVLFSSLVKYRVGHGGQFNRPPIQLRLRLDNTQQQTRFSTLANLI